MPNQLTSWLLEPDFRMMIGCLQTINLDETALTRLCEGIRIHRLIPGSTLITSAKGWENDISQAEVTAQAVIVLGVDSAQIKMQKNPKTPNRKQNNINNLSVNLRR